MIQALWRSLCPVYFHKPTNQSVETVIRRLFYDDNVYGQFPFNKHSNQNTSVWILCGNSTNQSLFQAESNRTKSKDKIRQNSTRKQIEWTEGGEIQLINACKEWNLSTNKIKPGKSAPGHQTSWWSRARELCDPAPQRWRWCYRVGWARFLPVVQTSRSHHLMLENDFPPVLLLRCF